MKIPRHTRPSLIHSIPTYTYTGGLGLAWLMLWVPLASDRPPRQSQQQQLAAASAATSTSSERITPPPAAAGATEEEDGESNDSNFIDGVAARVWAKLTSVPWGDFARSPELWAVTFAHMVRGVGEREVGGGGGDLDICMYVYILTYTYTQQKPPSQTRRTTTGCTCSWRGCPRTSPRPMGWTSRPPPPSPSPRGSPPPSSRTWRGTVIYTRTLSFFVLWWGAGLVNK